MKLDETESWNIRLVFNTKNKSTTSVSRIVPNLNSIDGRGHSSRFNFKNCVKINSNIYLISGSVCVRVSRSLSKSGEMQFVNYKNVILSGLGGLSMPIIRSQNIVLNLG